MAAVCVCQRVGIARGGRQIKAWYLLEDVLTTSLVWFAVFTFVGYAEGHLMVHTSMLAADNAG